MPQQTEALLGPSGLGPRPAEDGPENRKTIRELGKGLEQYLRCHGGRERGYSSAEDLTGAVGPERRQREITFSQRNGT
jgi:hypothetical protein